MVHIVLYLLILVIVGSGHLNRLIPKSFECLYCSDEAIRLHRDVVLLTDDRNLRLKAHVRNVPAKDIPSFLKWARVS